MNLYISDLDGTLLNNEAKVTSLSKKLLNEALKSNINFTIATARTPATVIDILEKINISLPIITMNGSAIFDLHKKEYIYANYINNDLVVKIKNIIEKHNIGMFIYTLKDNHLNVYHTELTNEAQKKFYNERNKSKYKTLIKEALDDTAKVLYFTILDNKDNIDILYNEINQISGLYIVKYKDTYIDCYNLEIYDMSSSKAKAIHHLKNQYNFDKLITFGDNRNDIPMFEISNECYAVENAVPELKEICTSTIGSNTDDSVAKFIYKLIGN